MTQERRTNVEAPDKIYVPQHNIEAENIQELDELIVVGSTEYIRKDALLEWAKGQKAWLKQGFKKDWKNEYTLNGGRLMLDRLINKLNSM